MGELSQEFGESSQDLRYACIIEHELWLPPTDPKSGRNCLLEKNEREKQGNNFEPSKAARVTTTANGYNNSNQNNTHLAI